MRHVFSLMLFAVTVIFPFQSFAQDRTADHEALRAVLKTSREAINTGNFDLLKPVLATENLTIITVDNHKFDSLESFQTYWKQLFNGPTAILKSIDIDPSADAPTEFIDENTGFVDGISKDLYRFKDGDDRTMETRWTALVQKKDGVWKISKIHFSADVLNNPVLSFASKAAGMNMLISALGGFLIGVLLTLLLRCRKKTC
jgi:hypothetical protein